jgi:hypothetical protein
VWLRESTQGSYELVYDFTDLYGLGYTEAELDRCADPRSRGNESLEFILGFRLPSERSSRYDALMQHRARGGQAGRLRSVRFPLWPICP